MSAHTDMCMDKHKIDVRALPIFRRQTGRHVQGHTHIYPLYSDNFLFTHAPPRKAIRPLTMGHNTLVYGARGYGATYVPFSDGPLPCLSL